MTGYLLDTHVALDAVDAPEQIWAAARDARANVPERSQLLGGRHQSAKGKLVVGEPRAWWYRTLTDLNAAPLLFRSEHLTAVADLPPIHQDPFERPLIAQATMEDLVLITGDRISRSTRTSV